jgi:hypothetical protein
MILPNLQSTTLQFLVKVGYILEVNSNDTHHLQSTNSEICSKSRKYFGDQLE